MEGLYIPKTIRTYCGQYINVVQIKPEQVFPKDIAIGLARECRFGNHTKREYSVAEHSVWCMYKAEELYPGDASLSFKMLLHDAHEAYLGDMCTPMVDAIDDLYPGFKDAVNTVKKIVQSAINNRFGIYAPFDNDARVKEIDRLALEWEWHNKKLNWKGILPLGAEAAADYWLEHFKKLVKVPVVIAA